MLCKTSGNMYGFITHRLNPIKGLCPHGCEYCYMHRFPQKEPRLDEKEFRAYLYSGNTIFVGSGIDMFAEAIPSEWIFSVIDYCNKFPENTYFFQSKNPRRFGEFIFPINSIFCTTIETNRIYPQMGKTPYPHDRAFSLSSIAIPGRRMVTIEPIMDFDLSRLVYLLKIAEPEQVNIGADSKRHNLPEPSAGKIRDLIAEIEEFTTVYKKPNLARLIGGSYADRHR